MRITTNDIAPIFDWKDIDGNEVSLSEYQGRSVLLSFYRYASCPFCNLRIAQLRNHSERLQRLGLDMIAVFQSPAEKIRQHAGQQAMPFPILPDPERLLYEMYGLEASYAGMAKAFMLRFPSMIRAFGKGFLPGSIEGEIHRLPADFIVDEQGTVAMAYYGHDIGDHVPIRQIDDWLSQRAPAAV
jgi:peroxiredoxin